MAKYEVSSKIVNATDLKDVVYYLNQLCNESKEGDVISFEPETYTIKRDFAMQKFCYLSNNDAGIKSIAMPIIGKKNIVIDGNGASLMGISRIMPFYLLDSENITIQNFTIDYVRPFYTQGEVIEADSESVLLKINKEEYPYYIKNNVVIFTGEDYSSYFMHGILEYEAETKRPAKDVIDNMSKSPITGKEEGEGLLRLYIPFNKVATVGNIMTIKHEERYIPAIGISNCKNITLKNIKIRHAGTMGVIAQFSENITLDAVDVATDKNSTRVMSANADATHFVNCKGTILVENCLLESQLDDVINVHGNYLRVVKVIDNTNLLVEIPHFQQVGAFSLKDGNNITICDQPTMLSLAPSKLKTSKTINSRYYLLTLEEPYNFIQGNSYAIDDADNHPEVIFRNNDCGRNRARGLLLTSTKKMIIENNKIDAEGSCIKVNSDMHFWYESSAISTLIIRGNKMRRANKVVWGEGIVDIDPGMENQKEGGYFHGDIIIEDNIVELDGQPFVFGYSFNSLTIKNNQFNINQNMKEEIPLSLENYGELIVENNKIIK